MKCIIESELTPTRFSELGEPYRIFNNHARDLVAVASQMPHLGFPGHWLFPDSPPSVHRLGIYKRSDGTMLGCIPTKYPINDVCFSQDSDNVLIATGSYDGGWSFEGCLLRFFFKTGRLEHLLGQSREVSACRYENDGFITVLIRPENEEEFLADGLDAWSIVLCAKIGPEPIQQIAESPELSREDARLAGLVPSAPSDHGFSDLILNPNPDQRGLWRNEARAWLREVRAEYYTGIWSLLWMNQDSFVLVANGVAIEQRDIFSGIQYRMECEGSGVEMINHPCLGLLSHVLFAGQHGGSIDSRSELWQWSENRLPTKMGFERPSAFSFDAVGNGLAIDVSWANQRDRKNLFLTPTGQTIQAIDCGISDRIGPVSFPSGLDALYFLKREGEQNFKNNDYRLWLVESKGGISCLRSWDSSDRDFCPVVSVALSRTTMLAAGPAWNRNAHQNLGFFVELVDLKSGHRSLSIRLPSSPTCVGFSEDQQTGFIGLVDGRIYFFNLQSGRLIGEMILPYRLPASVPLSLSIKENRMLVSTQDGRILLARIIL
jgi:hypothetical protein